MSLGMEWEETGEGKREGEGKKREIREVGREGSGTQRGGDGKEEMEGKEKGNGGLCGRRGKGGIGEEGRK